MNTFTLYDDSEDSSSSHEDAPRPGHDKQTQAGGRQTRGTSDVHARLMGYDHDHVQAVKATRRKHGSGSDSSSNNSSDSSDSDEDDSQAGRRPTVPSLDELFSSVQKPGFVEESDARAAKEAAAEAARLAQEAQEQAAALMKLRAALQAAEEMEQKEQVAKQLEEAEAESGFVSTSLKRSIARSGNSGTEASKKARVGMPPASMLGTPAEPQKPTAKDRVKNQRLNGQSGIGADFKSWRSEEEMRLRQHFD